MAFNERNVPIVAVATASGRGAVGIVRVSGKGLMPLALALCGRELAPRMATYGPFRDARGEAIDHGLALYFPGPHSYTGEDVLELQGHGGPVVMQLLLARCLEAAAEVDADTGRARLPGLRLAEPGEFTQRAFLNDKIDLAQAEAIADLIDASTEAAARSASRSLGGAFSQEIEALRERLIHLRMLVEATLDFPEEEIDFLEKANARGKLDGVAETLDAVLTQARQGALLREGLQVVLAGHPNLGNSSQQKSQAGAAAKRDAMRVMAQLMQPMTPHLAEEVWAMLGGATGGAVYGVMTHWFGIKPVTIAALLGSFFMVSLFGQTAPDLQMLALVSGITGFFINGAAVAFYVILARAFPVHVRASGAGFGIGTGRAGAVIGPALAGVLFAGGTPLAVVMILLATGSLVAAVAIYFLKLNNAEEAEADGYLHA